LPKVALADGPALFVRAGVPRTAFNERNGAFSPNNGRWIAYQSDESGRYEIYVQSFTPTQPSSGARVQVSSGGGLWPAWRRDGRELCYVTPERRMMTVEVTTDGPVFQSRQPRVLFSSSIDTQAAFRSYDVSADGSGFVFVEPVDAQRETQSLTLVTNWVNAVKK
jgi:hypothetical protein